MNHSVARRPLPLANAQIAALSALASSSRALSVSAAPCCRDRGELGRIDVDGDDLGAEGAGDLHAVAADAAGADDDGEAAGRDAGAAHRLVRAWSPHRRRPTRRRASRPAVAAGLRRPRTGRARARRCAMAKPPWMSLPGIFCAAADGRAAALAQIAFAAGEHGRHDHRLAEPALGARAGGDDAAADLVAERQRQRMVGAHAVVEVAEVGVADAAAGDRDHHFAGACGEASKRAHSIGDLVRVISQRWASMLMLVLLHRFSCRAGRAPKDRACVNFGITVLEYRFEVKVIMRGGARVCIDLDQSEPAPCRLTVASEGTIGAYVDATHRQAGTHGGPALAPAPRGYRAMYFDRDHGQRRQRRDDRGQPAARGGGAGRLVRPDGALQRAADPRRRGGGAAALRPARSNAWTTLRRAARHRLAEHPPLRRRDSAPTAAS